MTMMTTTKPSNEDPDASVARAVRALIVLPQDAARWKKGEGSLDLGRSQGASPARRPGVDASPYRSDGRCKRSLFQTVIVR